MEVANSLAYYYMATITAVKGFIVQAPEVDGKRRLELKYLIRIKS